MPFPSFLPEGPLAPGTVLQPRHLVVGDLQLGYVDDYGAKVYLTDLVGWDGAAGTTLTVEQRYADDGGWASDAHLPPRMIDAQVQIVAGSGAAVARSLQLLMGRVPTRRRAEMTVDDHGLELVADVIQSGEILATRKGNVARLSIPLVAPDPRRYSTAIVEASTGLPNTVGGVRLPVRTPFRVQGVTDLGRVVVVNAGTEVTLPTFTVHGPCPAFTLTHLDTLATLRYHEDVPDGRTVVIDTAARSVLVDGVAPRYVSGSWFGYLPGANEVAFGATSYDAAALLVSRHRHAWK